jgi:large subunit ribosomal protein L24
MARSVAPIRATKVPEIRKGDTVVVLAGKDAGKRGVVERVMRNPQGSILRRRRWSADWAARSPLSEAAVIVEGLNIAKRHTKPRQTSSSTDRMPKIQQGGILDIAQPLPLSRVMLVCPKCDQPTRIAHTTLDNGRRIRVCKHCGEALEVTGS